MKTKHDAQSVVRRLHQVGYSLAQTDQTPKLTQLMKDSITLIEQMHADVKALTEALASVLPIAEASAPKPAHEGSCGPWESCDCSCKDAANASQLLWSARAALAGIQGEAG